MMSVETLIVFTVCGALTWLLCYHAPRLCTWAGLMDIPDARKRHANPTPLVGGLAVGLIVLPMSFALALFVLPPDWRKMVLLYGAATIAVILLGLEDDRRTLSARNRLILSVIIFASAATLDPLFNIRVLRFSDPAFELGMGVTAGGVAFTTLCCVGLINALNMADGKNGLVIGLSLGWLAMLFSRAPAPLMPLIGLLITCLLLLLLFNLKGRVFLGDGGVYGIAGAIALLAIAIYNSQGPIVRHGIAAEELMLLFGVPVLDSFRLTWSRLRRGQSPMAADRDHFHHHLQLKFGWPGGLVVYLAIALIPAAIGFARIVPPTLCIGIVVVLYAATIMLTRTPAAIDQALNR